MPNGKPNIVVFWGDDIGITNLSAYSDGLMGYRTPNIDRVADEGMRFTDCLRRAELHRRPVRVHHRAERLSHRPVQGGHARFRRRHAGRGPDDRGAAQAARVCHRAVRQEPPGRPGQAPPDRPRLRRVLRQPVPPQRGGGAGARGLPEARGLPGLQGELRAARRAALPGERRRHADDRGHRSADARSGWRRSTTRSSAARSTSSSASTPTTCRSSCGSTPPTCTSGPTPSRSPWASPGGGSRSTTTR